jgi:hypothetical protein
MGDRETMFGGEVTELFIRGAHRYQTIVIIKQWAELASAMRSFWRSTFQQRSMITF